MSTIPAPYFVDIFEDGVLIGNGEVSRRGELLECHAPVSEEVLDALEAAIESGQKSVKIGPHSYSWASSAALGHVL